MASAPQQPPRTGRFLSFDIQHLRDSREGFWFLVDMLMLFLLVLNLLLIIVDSLYRLDVIEAAVKNSLPLLVPSLDYLRANFLVIDLVFVCIFLAEFNLRWWVSVKRGEYPRWFYFPFIHWYDLVGCIPLAGARMLRFLRVFSIIYRLHKYRIIDVRQSSVFRFFAFYYDVLMEELSDRVVMKVVSGIQEDIRQDDNLSQQIVRDLITPRLEKLSESASLITGSIAEAMLHEQQHPFAVQLRESVIAAMQNNEELQRLKYIPIVGEQLAEQLESSVAEIVIDTIAELIRELPELMQAESLRNSVQAGSAAWDALDQEIVRLLDEVLEFVKQQVGRQSWKNKLNEEIPA